MSVSLLLREFDSYKMGDNMDMSAHISNVEAMAQRLVDVGQAVSEAQVIAKLLDLPPKYIHLVSAWDVLDEARQTRANLIPRLLKAEKLCCDGGPCLSSVQSEDDDSVACAARSKDEPNGKSNDRNERPKFKGNCIESELEKSQCFKQERDLKKGKKSSQGAAHKGSSRTYRDGL